jgi:tetratricopeptide (TPR) repeat protein
VDAVFSGQAGAIAFIEGRDVRVHRLSDLQPEVVIPREEAAYLFQSCNDIVVMRGTNKEFARTRFLAAWEADRALRMILLSLDLEQDPELRIEAADWLETLLSRSEATLHIENQMYSRPLPPDTDYEFLTKNTKWLIAAALIKTIVRRQATISAVRKAWDAIPSELFENNDKAEMEERAIHKGAFRILASVDLDKDDPNLAILACHQALATLPNARSIVSAWTKEFIRPGSKRLVAPEESEEIETESSRVSVRSRKAYETAIQQLNVIIGKMRAGSQRLARIYAEQLIQYQLEHGGPEFAAKSLCNLAQEAKSIGLFSLQLEWAQRAVDVCPNDSWAHGQAADALLQFSRLDEALAEFDLSEAYGDAQFAATGRARILRHQGRLDEALHAFRAARTQFAGYEGEVFAWMGAAETLRDMWKLEDALHEYEEAIVRFSDSKPLRCGRAAVLSDLGQLDDALRAYDEPELRDEFVALNGKASVLKELGQFQNALNVVSRAIELVPTDPISRCLQADILRAKGDLVGALQVYSDVKSQYPNIPVAYSGYAEVLRDMGRLPEAIEAYMQASDRFPYDAYLASGYANIRKVNDELEESLRLYEKNVGKFPYDLVSKSGRADLLKRLGHYDDAIRAYDEILSIWPLYEPARNGKAAILAVRGEFDRALLLLGEKAPTTRNDWIAWNIRGMILLRKGELDRAIAIFEEGRSKTPFARERRYFEGALSVARMRKGQFDQAAQSLAESPAGGGLLKVLRLHAYAGKGDLPLARVSYAELSNRCPGQLIDLRDAIAARYGIIRNVEHHNDNWIFDRESEALLQEAA